MSNIQEVTLAMIHDKAHKVIYDDFMMLDDNFDDEVSKGFTYVGTPVKLLFVTLIICLRGRMRIRVNLKEMIVEANNVLLIIPGSIIDMVVCEGDCRMAVMHIDNDKVAHQPSVKILLQLRTIIKNESFITRFRESAMLQFVEGYKMMRKVINDETLKFKNEAIEGCFQAMAAYWMSEIEFQSQFEAAPKITRNEQIFKHFLNLVQKNYMVHREVSFYADQICITAKYLGVVVAQVSGRRPLDWIRDYVILDAKAMLLSREYSIQQISQLLNFPNPSFFSKYFREAVGYSPSKYLNKEGE